MTRTVFLVASLIFSVIVFIWFSFSLTEDQQPISTAGYRCPPCAMACDELTFEKDGVCPHCNMNLIMDLKVNPLNEINLIEGSGNFLIDGGGENEDKTIRIFYHLPENFNTHSKVLLVLHGAGRNGNDYRDAWVEASEKYGVLVLSPQYSDKDYPQFWNYNLAGMIEDVEINADRTSMVDFKINQDTKEWIFNDFDRIFELVKNRLGMSSETYDLFGHSAGGQVLHRFAIFNANNNADRILAANSGWYTVPDIKDAFPVGLKNGPATAEDLSFSKKLVIFLGEKDDADETRGDLRHTPELDKQGTHRYARGKYFYNTSKEVALKLGKAFNWKMETIPGVGHDYIKMSKAAAAYLYE